MRAQKLYPPPERLARSQHGFTLVEILVALAIGMAILAALGLIFSRQSGNQSELERATRQIENARFALDLLAEDLQHAGYFGEFNPDGLPVAPLWTTPGACAANLAGLGWATPAAGAPSMPVAVQGLAAEASAGLPACLAERVPGTEALVLRHADTGAPVALGVVSADDLYLQTSRCSGDTNHFAVGSSSADFGLRAPTCGANLNDEARRLVQRSYFIAACNDCAQNDGIPTLKRTEWSAGALRTVAVAEGIENLQFDYGLDTDGDGQPNEFVATAGVSGVAPRQWNNVVSVRVHLLARESEPTAGYVDGRTYSLGVGGVTVTPPPSDRFKRRLLTSTVRLLNVGGRRE